MIERCGWSSAWASVSWPLRRISSTSEWSRVSRSSLPAAQPVGAAVADVADRHLFALGVDDRRGQRRAHARPRGVGAGELVDRAVGGEDRLAQDLLRRRRRAGRRRRRRRPLCEATSPAWAPPIPSATTKIGARTKKESSLALRWRPVSVRKAWSSIRSIAPTPRCLVPELGVADPDHVAVDQLRLAVQGRVVEQGAVGRVHVLDVGAPVASEDPGVHAGGIAVVDPHVGFGGAADREAADQVEALARRRGRRRARRPARRRWRWPARERPGTWWKPVASGAGETVRRRSLSALRAIQSRKR